MSKKTREIGSLPAEALKELEGDWRAGLMSLQVLALKYRVDAAEIRAFAKRAGWDGGDLGSAIQNASTAALVQRAVNGSFNDGLTPDARETVRMYGQIVAGFVELQRSQIGRARAYAAKLMAELEALMGPDIDLDRISTMANAMEAQDPEFAKLLRGDGKRKSLLPMNEQLNLLAKKADILRTLSQSMKNFVEMERVAWGLDKPGGGSAGYDEFLDELHGEKPSNEPKRVN